MRVVFLDFDGVVVVLPNEHGHLRTGKLVRNANRAAVAQLNDLVARTGAEVVVTSTWRLHSPIDYLTGTLQRGGFRGRVLDVTPDLDEKDPATGLWRRLERGHEVAAWLKAHPAVTHFVVLDDDADRGPIPEHQWILVRDGWLNGGLLPEHVERAAAVLLGTA